MPAIATGLDEEAGFIDGPRGERLFGILHRAAPPARGEAIVYCSAILEEKMNCHRIGVNFARCAAAQGFDVLRFDYAGDGESSGDFVDNSVPDRVEDILAAAGWVRNTVNPARLSLLGLRFGAALALLAAEASEEVERVVCWAPVLQGGPYLYGVLRTNVAAQFATHRKVIHDREALVARIRAGSTVEVEGWEIGRALYESAEAVDFLERPLASDADILAVRIAPNAGDAAPFTAFSRANAGRRIDVADVSEIEFWAPQNIAYPACAALFERTIAWLRSPLAKS